MGKAQAGLGSTSSEDVKLVQGSEKSTSSIITTQRDRGVFPAADLDPICLVRMWAKDPVWLSAPSAVESRSFL